MAIDKIRQGTSALPNAPTDEWAYCQVVDDRLQFNSDGANTRIVMDSAAEVVAAANVITAAENGKVFFLNSATEFASTLPAPALGLRFTFIVAAAPSGASYTIATADAAQILAGQVYASSGGDEDSETANTATTITFVDGTAVIGDSADVWSDGTSWFARCFCNATGGITITG